MKIYSIKKVISLDLILKFSKSGFDLRTALINLVDKLLMIDVLIISKRDNDSNHQQQGQKHCGGYFEA